MNLKQYQEHLESQLAELKFNANRAISHVDTVLKKLEHYPKIKQFITASFPDSETADVPIYLVSTAGMRRARFYGMHGCFIPSMNIIFALQDGNECPMFKKTSRFESVLKSKLNSNITEEYVVLHESLHAVSENKSRTNRLFRNNEEEFVHQNCIRFCKEHNWPEKDIMDTLIAYCFNNIFSNKKQTCAVFDKLKIAKKLSVVPWEKNYTVDEFNRFINKHAEFIIDEFLVLAKIEGTRLIENSISKQTSVRTVPRLFSRSRFL